jgi:hypothetical protein
MRRAVSSKRDPGRQAPPDRFIAMSGKMAAIVAYVLDESMPF